MIKLNIAKKKDTFCVVNIKGVASYMFSFRHFIPTADGFDAGREDDAALFGAGEM